MQLSSFEHGVSFVPEGDTSTVGTHTEGRDVAMSSSRTITICTLCLLLTAGSARAVDRTVQADGLGEYATIVDGWPTFHGLTITGGRHVNGGAVTVDTYTPRFIECRFIGNQAELGGAIHATGVDSVVFERCLFSENKATEDGGAIVTVGKTDGNNYSGTTQKPAAKPGESGDRKIYHRKQR